MGLAGGNWRREAARAGKCALIGLGLLAVAACAPVFRNHGYAPTEQELALVEVGRDTRETVSSSVGRPSAAGLLNDEGWYYVQSRYRHYGAAAPQEVERQVVAISFTPEGVVSNVERFGLDQGRVVPLSRRVTESNIRGISFISQLLGSFGTLRASDVLP